MTWDTCWTCCRVWRGQYGAADAGSLVTLLCMNYPVFSAGEALYIPADGIHACLCGDIVEYMARAATMW